MTGRSGKTDLPSEGAGAGGKERPNPKRTGELAEAAFLHKTVGLGLKVTKPWGDSERYDFVVDAGERLWRVRIKCTAAVRAGGYHIQPIHFVYGKKKVTYTAEDIDVLAAYIIPLDVWYVVPIEAIGAGMSLRLYPEGGCKVARFEGYHEGWGCLVGWASGLRGRRGGGSGFCSDAGLEAFYFSGEVTDASILALAMEIPTLVSPKGGETRVGHPRE